MKLQANFWPQQTLQYGPPPQTQPDINQVMKLYDFMSPEKDAQLAMTQDRLHSIQEGDKYAQGLTGAPSMEAAHLFQQNQAHQDMEPLRLAQIARANEQTQEHQAGTEYAHGKGYPSLPAYEFDTREQDRQTARQGLQDQHAESSQLRAQRDQDHLTNMVGQMPMAFQPDDPKHPLPPFMRVQKELLRKNHPELFQDSQSNALGLTPAQIQKLINSK